MKKLIQHSREIGYAAIIVVCIFLVISAVLLSSEHSKSLEEQAVSRVEGYSHNTSEILVRNIDALKKSVVYICEDLANCSTDREVTAIFNTARERSGVEDLICIRFFKDGVEYTQYGMPYLFREADAIIKLVGTDTDVRANVIYDDEHNQLELAVYSNIEDSEFFDSVVFYFPLGKIKTSLQEQADRELLDKSEVVVLCTEAGKIVDTLHKTSETIDTSENMLDYLLNKTSDKVLIDDIERRIAEGRSGAFAITINGVPYVVSIGGAGQDGGGLCIIGFYLAENAYAAGYQIVNIILTIMIIVFGLLILFGIAFIIGRQITKKKIANALAIDPLLGCNTAVGFARSTDDILHRNKATQFAIVSFEFKFFTYVTEHFGEEVSNDLLKFLKTCCAREMSEEETYGHGTDGEFFLLLHFREKRILMNRLNNIYAMIRKYPGLKGENFSISAAFGIFMLERSADEGNAQKMMDKAVIARNTPTMNGKLSDFSFYSDTIRESYMQQADVETRAESALANNEFKVFFQPKLDIKRGRIDSAEALVRWYDPEKDVYRSPATFLPVFESNGFIVKLDKYVYKTVCEYISESVKNGIQLYPISVNISRFTASQDDFFSYYVGMKQQHSIPDGLITLEFSESFAQENLEFLNSVVSQMHKNGFKCCIDDFGTGSSPFSMLKQIPMDTIKLDRLFIRKGIAADRDNAIIENTIKIAKALNMKVVQTGVETIDDVNRLKAAGCDAIQGYYYSKPLATSDYIAFIEQHKND